MDTIMGIGPGNILAVRSTGLAADAIRLGADLIHEDTSANHIAVLDHKDDRGTWWCLEGRPGGVGWRDATAYLQNPYTITNRAQMLTTQQRSVICWWMQHLINTKYDWEAIAEDGLRDLHIPDPWGERWKGQVAGHVVCSSSAVIAYAKASAGYPQNIDQAHVQPADWVKFIIENHYE